MTLKSDKHYVTICVGTYIQGCYFSCIAYYRNKGNRKKRRGLFQSMDPRLVSADGLEKPLILSYFIKKMEEKRKSRQISPTKSKPREEKIEEAQEETTTVSTQPVSTMPAQLFSSICSEGHCLCLLGLC